MATYSKRKIYQFKKTKHFYESAHKRAIHDEILELVLKYYQDHNYHKIKAIFPEKFLKKHNIATHYGHLVIVIKFNYLLITTFWCNKPQCLTNKRKKERVVVFPENRLITKYTDI